MSYEPSFVRMKPLKYKNKVCIFLAALFVVTGCKKNNISIVSNNSPVIHNPNVDVYVAGTGANGNAAYWKNGVPTDLRGIDANQIISNGLETYVVGSSSDINGNRVAMYWVNGSPIYLPGIGGDALAIATNGADVYVVGSLNSSPGTGGPVYWKNGVATQLASGSTNPTGVAESIAISGNDVYIVGYTTDNNFNYVPTIWKNGIPIFLHSTNSNAIAYAIAISNNNIYVAGTSGTSSGGDFFMHQANTKAICWEYGSEKVLLDNSPNSGASAIVINGNDIYIGGYSNDSNGALLTTYWKNGNETKLPLLSQKYSIYSTTGIAAVGGDVYVSGQTGAYPGYWINGTPVQLDATSSPSGASFACSIAVVPH